MRNRTVRWIARALTVAVVVIGCVAPTGAAGPRTDTARAGSGDDILWPGGHARRLPRLAGPGYNTLDDTLRSTIGTWVFRLHDDEGVEAVREGMTEAAAQLTEITGSSYVVAPGTTTRTDPEWGELIVRVSHGDSPCPEAAACGGPSHEFGTPTNNSIVAGHVWVNPDTLLYSADDRILVMKHEIGHVMGLGHFDDPFQGQLQNMNSGSYDARDYRAGDINGLHHMYDGYFGPFRNEQEFVDTQFLALARRFATPTERFTWTTKIKGDHPAAFTLAGSLLDASANSELGSLTRLYLAYFKRPPDQAGYTYWIAWLRAHRPLDQVSQSFAKSSEFTRAYGTLSNTAFVQLVYQNVLGRDADGNGTSYWVSRLGTGVSRGAVMTGFSQSGEYRRATNAGRRVEIAFTALLGRVPTAAEYTALVDAFTAGKLTPAGLTRRLIESETYANRVTN